MQQEMMLISSAMISSIWEANRKDTIDLIIPFVKFIIYENYNENVPLDNTFILHQLRERFSFDIFPNIILDKVLNRLCKSNSTLVRKNGLYYVNQIDENYKNNFLSKENKYKNSTNEIIDELIKFLKDNSAKVCTEREKIEDYLYNYLSKYINKTYLNEEYDISPKFEKENFWISKFLYHLKENKIKMFDSFNDFAVGFMLSKALYFDYSQSHKKIKLKVYIDAPLMLTMLGLKSSEENDSAEQLFKLLKENDFDILIYSHSIDELKSIITDYLVNRNNPYHKRIEYFDDNKSNVVYIETYRDNIEEKITNLGIKIIDSNSIQSNIDVDDVEIFGVLQQTYSISAKEKALKSDTISLKSIIKLRNSNSPMHSIDRCKHIFVSKNNDLVKAGKILLQCKENEYGLAISENDLITILWIRSKKSIRDISKLKLITFAHLSMEPNPLLINTYIKTIRQLKKDKNIVSTDFLILLDKVNNKRELMEISQGEVKNISKETITNRISTLYYDTFKLPVVSNTEKLISRITNVCKVILIIIISLIIFIPNVKLAYKLILHILGKADYNYLDIIIAIIDAAGIVSSIFNLCKKTDWFAIKFIKYLCNKIRNLLYYWYLK